MEQNEKKEFDITDFLKRRKGEILFLVLGLFLGIYFDWAAVQILIFLIFLWSLLGPIASRYLAATALFFLVLTPVLLLLKRTERAEDFAIYAYYFLVMAVIRGIMEIREEKDSEHLII